MDVTTSNNLLIADVLTNLVRLRERRPGQALQVRDMFTFTLKNTPFRIEWEKYVRYDVDIQVRYCYTAGDTRPISEMHIRAGNTRMYVFRIKEIRLILPLLTLRVDRDWAEHLGMPGRDWVAAEDFLWSNRRGTLTDKFNESLRALIENTVSVPINDPAVRELGANVMEDSFYLARVFRETSLPVYKLF
jgi:hypothetical protein